MDANELKQDFEWAKSQAKRQRMQEASDKASDGRQTDATDASDDRLDSARGLSATELSAIHGPSRRIKTVRSDENYTPGEDEKTNWRRVGEWSALFLMIAGAGSTIRGMPVRISLTYFLGAAACMIAPDGLQLAGRWLAPATRIIVSVMIVAAGSALHITVQDYRIAVGIVVLIGTALTVLMNKYWLEAYNHSMCPEVKKAMKNDPRNRAAKAWADKGAKQCWALAWELGHQASDFTINRLFRTYWLAGFWTGLEKNNMQKAKVEKMEDLEEENGLLNEYFEKALKSLEQYEKWLEDVRTAKRELDDENRSLEMNNRRLIQQIQELRLKQVPKAAPEEAPEEEPEITLVTKTEKAERSKVDQEKKDKEIKEIIERYLRNNYSTRDIKALGVFKPSYVDAASKIYNAEKAAAEKAAEKIA